MLQQLETLIGFAVVMTVVSLLITIITQIASALLGLRGSNLADGLEAPIDAATLSRGLQQRLEIVEPDLGMALERPRELAGEPSAGNSDFGHAFKFGGHRSGLTP